MITERGPHPNSYSTRESQPKRRHDKNSSPPHQSIIIHHVNAVCCLGFALFHPIQTMWLFVWEVIIVQFATGNWLHRSKYKQNSCNLRNWSSHDRTINEKSNERADIPLNFSIVDSGEKNAYVGREFFDTVFINNDIFTLYIIFSTILEK